MFRLFISKHQSPWIEITLLLLYFSILGGSFAPALAQRKDPLVAKVNWHEIHLADVFASIESFPIGDQINMRKRIDLVIQSLVNGELLFQSVLSPESKWERQLRNEIKALVVERVIKKIVTERAKVSDAEIREYYQANRDELRGWHVRVRHIQMESKTECDQMIQRITSEKMFAEMAKAHSLDRSSAAKGGDLGYLMYSPDGSQSLGFELKFFEMAKGEMRVFESKQGCHLIRVIDIDDPPDPPFKRIREFLKPKLEEKKESALLQALIEKLSRNSSVKIINQPSR